MIKRSMYSLALHASESSQKFVTNVTRVRSGFLAEQNLIQAERELQEMQTLLQTMRKLVHQDVDFKSKLKSEPTNVLSWRITISRNTSGPCSGRISLRYSSNCFLESVQPFFHWPGRLTENNKCDWFNIILSGTLLSAHMAARSSSKVRRSSRNWLTSVFKSLIFFWTSTYLLRTGLSWSMVSGSSQPP